MPAAFLCKRSVSDLWHTSWRNSFINYSVGFRFASTTGYYLTASHADQPEHLSLNYFVGLLRTTVIELTLLYG